MMNTIRLASFLSRPLRRPCCRCYSSSADVPPLPDIEKWRDLYLGSTTNYSKDRVSVSDPQTATRLVHSFVSNQSPAAGEGKIVVEAFPGPGALSRALLRLPEHKIQKLIILEDNKLYLEALKPLEDDPRVTVVPLSGFDWDTYSTIEDMGLLSEVERHDWNEVHPHLHFIGHLEQGKRGEQLISQLYRCIPDKSWLFKYGRVPLSMVLSNTVWGRCSSSIKKAARCKLTILAEATGTTEPSVDPETLKPYDKCFWPVSTAEGKRSGQVAVNIIPHSEQVIPPGMLDKWDYCLRRLFVLKSTPLKRAISSLAPGAQTLLKVLADPNLPPEQRLDVTKSPRDMNIADWALLVRAFDNWPFAPEELLISDAFSRENTKIKANAHH